MMYLCTHLFTDHKFLTSDRQLADYWKTLGWDYTCEAVPVNNKKEHADNLKEEIEQELNRG